MSPFWSLWRHGRGHFCCPCALACGCCTSNFHNKHPNVFTEEGAEGASFTVRHVERELVLCTFRSESISAQSNCARTCVYPVRGFGEQLSNLWVFIMSPADRSNWYFNEILMDSSLFTSSFSCYISFSHWKKKKSHLYVRVTMWDLYCWWELLN